MIMRTAWSRETIIRYLVERHAKGLPMSRSANRVDLLLHAAARRIFGSWKNAIQSAGIPPHTVIPGERWSPPRVLTMIRHLAKKDRQLTHAELDRRYRSLASSARRHFGSWRKAVLAAGVEPIRLRKVVPWSPDRVMEFILTRALRNECLIARRIEPRSVVAAARRLFGSWQAAIQAAGVDVLLTQQSLPCPAAPDLSACPKRNTTQVRRAVRANVRWTKERIVTALRARLNEHKPLNPIGIARDDDKLYQALRRHMGSWEGALRAAGIDPELHRRGKTRSSGAVSRATEGSSQAVGQMRPNGPC